MIAPAASTARRSTSDWLRFAVGLVAVAMSVYHVYTAGSVTPAFFVHYPVHLCFVLVLALIVAAGRTVGWVLAVVLPMIYVDWRSDLIGCAIFLAVIASVHRRRRLMQALVED